MGILHELTQEKMEDAKQHHFTERSKEKTVQDFRKLIKLRTA